MDNSQQLNKDRITDAIAAFAGGSPSEIVDSIAALTDSEKMVVKLVQELTAPPVKSRAKRSDAGKSRVKPDSRSVAAMSRGDLAQVS